MSTICYKCEYKRTHPIFVNNEICNDCLQQKTLAEIDMIEIGFWEFGDVIACERLIGYMPSSAVP